MTEAEWLACGDPARLLQFLQWHREPSSDRKARLFACACVRRVRRLLTDARSRRALEACEGYTEGRVTGEALRAAHLEAGAAFAEAQWAAEGDERTTPARAALHLGVADDFSAAWSADWSAAAAGVAAREVGYEADPQTTGDWEQYNPAYLEGRAAEERAQAVLLRDIFGNPFRSVTFSPSWRTDTAVALARQMYDARDFSAMPILADALQDAGCDSDDVLNHCRGPGPHVRGCWVMDLVLGKE
jgi:hypothetical protein